MPSDPERPIEKLLRDCAKERRAHAGDWELHPANRRLLQQEVAQKFGRKIPESRPGLFLRFYSQWWAKAIGGMAVVAMAAVIVRFSLPSRAPKENEILLARNETAIKSKTAVSDEAGAVAVNKPALNEAQERIPQEIPVPSKTLVAKEETLESRRDAAEKDSRLSSTLASADAKQQDTQAGLLADREISRPSASATPSSQPTPAVDQPGDAFRKRYGFAGGQAASPPPSPAAAPGGAVAQAELKQDAPTTLSSSVSLRQQAPEGIASARFVDSTANQVKNGDQATQLGFFTSTQSVTRQQRSYALDQKTAPFDAMKKETADISNPGRVLTYFRIEQSGSKLRIIDSDDSVYVGQIESQLAVPAMAAASADLSQSKRSEIRQVAPLQAAAAKQTALRPRLQQTSLPGYSFEVVGTNRTSNQRVVFSGILAGLTNTVDQLPSRGVGGITGAPEASLGRATQSSDAQAIASQPTLHVSGSALIGSAQSVEIDASPVPSRPKVP